MSMKHRGYETWAMTSPVIWRPQNYGCRGLFRGRLRHYEQFGILAERHCRDRHVGFRRRYALA